ncbi:ABC-2 family transporter protein [Streptomyces antimycoticus]|uniref:ABC transporter permease n=1 Tax=Streptomyces antimycoticus TaxID=68175 RepID=UPI00342E6C84
MTTTERPPVAAGSHLAHYSRLVWRITRMNGRARLRFRADLLLSVLYAVLFQLSALTFAIVVLQRFTSLGGWTAPEVMLAASLRVLSHSVHLFLFKNLARVPEMVRTGEFDVCLHRPVPPLLQVLLKEFHVTVFGDLAFAVTLFVVASQQMDLDWTVPMVLFLVAAVLGAALLEGAIQLVMASMAFRTEASDILMTWTDNLITTFANYPVTIFPWAVRLSFMTFFPIAFIAFFPASVILGRADEAPVSPVLAYAAPAIDLVVFALACLWWTRSVRSYQSKGA